MKRGVLNKLIISLLLVVAGLAVYIYYSNNEEESVIRLDKDLINIYVGENKILNILPDDVSYYELTWKSDNDLIASVSNGIVRGNNVGNTIISLYSNGQLLDRCLVRVIDFDSEISAVDQETNSQIEVIPPEDESLQYTIKYYDATIIETGLSWLLLKGSDKVPLVNSNKLSLSPNSSYVVSFDYKTVRGNNKFNVDLSPDNLPEISLNATVINQHYDWELSSDSNNMINCNLRFFDNYQEALEKDIIVSNIIMGTVRSDTKLSGDTIGTMPTPTRNGYNFLGWYTLRDSGTKINSNTIVTENMVLYPHWEEKTKVLPNEFMLPRGYSVVSNGIYNSNTLKYKTIKYNDSERYYSLIWVKDANRQINSANNYLKGGERQDLLNKEINNQNLKTKGIIAVNGSFSISNRANIPIIANKGSITINTKYNSEYSYGTLSIGSDNMLKYYVASDTIILSDWLMAIGARNTWAVTHFTTNFQSEKASPERRTAICQVDNHNFVLYSGYSSSIGNYMKELHDIFGCKSVANLDGGGSSGMYYKTKGMSKVGVIYEYSRENDISRVIGDMLYFTE